MTSGHLSGVVAGGMTDTKLITWNPNYFGSDLIVIYRQLLVNICQLEKPATSRRVWPWSPYRRYDTIRLCVFYVQ